MSMNADQMAKAMGGLTDPEAGNGSAPMAPLTVTDVLESANPTLLQVLTAPGIATAIHNESDLLYDFLVRDDTMEEIFRMVHDPLGLNRTVTNPQERNLPAMAVNVMLSRPVGRMPQALEEDENLDRLCRPLLKPLADTGMPMEEPNPFGLQFLFRIWCFMWDRRPREVLAYAKRRPQLLVGITAQFGYLRCVELLCRVVRLGIHHPDSGIAEWLDGSDGSRPLLDILLAECIHGTTDSRVHEGFSVFIGKLVDATHQLETYPTHSVELRKWLVRNMLKEDAEAAAAADAKPSARWPFLHALASASWLSDDDSVGALTAAASCVSAVEHLLKLEERAEPSCTLAEAPRVVQFLVASMAALATKVRDVHKRACVTDTRRATHGLGHYRYCLLTLLHATAEIDYDCIFDAYQQHGILNFVCDILCGVDCTDAAVDGVASEIASAYAYRVVRCALRRDGEAAERVRKHMVDECRLLHSLVAVRKLVDEARSATPPRRGPVQSPFVDLIYEDLSHVLASNSAFAEHVKSSEPDELAALVEAAATQRAADAAIVLGGGERPEKPPRLVSPFAALNANLFWEGLPVELFMLEQLDRAVAENPYSQLPPPGEEDEAANGSGGSGAGSSPSGGGGGGGGDDPLAEVMKELEVDDDEEGDGDTADAEAREAEKLVSKAELDNEAVSGAGDIPQLDIADTVAAAEVESEAILHGTRPVSPKNPLKRSSAPTLPLPTKTTDDVPTESPQTRLTRSLSSSGIRKSPMSKRKEKKHEEVRELKIKLMTLVGELGRTQKRASDGDGDAKTESAAIQKEIEGVKGKISKLEKDISAKGFIIKTKTQQAAGVPLVSLKKAQKTAAKIGSILEALPRRSSKSEIRLSKKEKEKAEKAERAEREKAEKAEKAAAKAALKNSNGKSSPEKTDKSSPEKASADEGAQKDEAKEAAAEPDEATADEAKTDESETDEAKTDEPKPDEAKADESKTDESKPEEAKTEESKTEEAKAEQSATPADANGDVATTDASTPTETGAAEEGTSDAPKSDEAGGDATAANDAAKADAGDAGASDNADANKAEETAAT